MQSIDTHNTKSVRQLVRDLRLPSPASHKGQNGKLLVIGGSELFHASFLWSAEIASRIVDMVHVVSPAEVNNRLMRERLKEKFWNGIVVPWDRVHDYIAEDDSILIGPGMPRVEGLEKEERLTGDIVDELLRAHPQKKWILDGGALQEVDPTLLTGQIIVTPHHKEWERLSGKGLGMRDEGLIKRFSLDHGGLTILLKGQIDTIVAGEKIVMVEGGNAGMTKGGTGDVLAGLTAALATMNENYQAAVTASAINKYAGNRLFERVGTFFNASDLLNEIPVAMAELLGR